MIRDLRLPKQSAELQRSRLQEENLLTPGTSFAWYRNREKHFELYFSKNGKLVYCSNINGLMSMFNVQHVAEIEDCLLIPRKKNKSCFIYLFLYLHTMVKTEQ